MRMKSISKIIVTAVYLLAFNAVLFAQEAEAAESSSPNPEGLGTLVLLLGIGALLAVGFVINARGEDDIQS